MNIKTISANFMDMRDAINSIHDAHTLFTDAVISLYGGKGELPAEADNAQAEALCAYENALNAMAMAAIVSNAERSPSLGKK